MKYKKIRITYPEMQIGNMILFITKLFPNFVFAQYISNLIIFFFIKLNTNTKFNVYVIIYVCIHYVCMLI